MHILQAARHGPKLLSARGAAVLLAGLLWLTAVGAGFGALALHAARASAAASASLPWPSSSRLAAPQGSGTLLLFAHPFCPCTRATLTALDRALSRGDGRVDARVIFVADAGIDAAEVRSSPLWQRANRIPGVQVEIDDGGVEARRFDATTSGLVIAYDAAGRAVFRGGITASRGHEGDSAGADALVDFLSGRPSTAASASVFGCSLFAKRATGGEG